MTTKYKFFIAISLTFFSLLGDCCVDYYLKVARSASVIPNEPVSEENTCTLTATLSNKAILATAPLTQTTEDSSETISCNKKRPRCSNGKKAFCTNKSFSPRCLPGGIPDCCKKIIKLERERGLNCKPELLKCPK